MILTPFYALRIYVEKNDIWDQGYLYCLTKRFFSNNSSLFKHWTIASFTIQHKPISISTSIFQQGTRVIISAIHKSIRVLRNEIRMEVNQQVTLRRLIKMRWEVALGGDWRRRRKIMTWWQIFLILNKSPNVGGIKVWLVFLGVIVLLWQLSTVRKVWDWCEWNKNIEYEQSSDEKFGEREGVFWNFINEFNNRRLLLKMRLK